MRFTAIFTTLSVICIMCFSGVNAVTEDRWKHYFTGSDGSKHFYDTKSISRTRTSKGNAKGNTRRTRGRIKRGKSPPTGWIVKVREKAIFNEPDSELKESKILAEFDCPKRKVRIIMESESYSDGLKKIEGKTGPWEDIDSEPFLEALYKRVCS